MVGTIEVDIARTCDAEALLAALEDLGLDGELVDDEGRLAVRVTSEGDSKELDSEFEALLEGWVADCGLPLIPTRLGEGQYLLRPPGD